VDKTIDGRRRLRLAMFERIGFHNGQFGQDTVHAPTHILWRGIAPAGLRDAPRTRTCGPTDQPGD